MIQKLGALQTYGLKYSPSANRSSPNSAVELVAINSATAFVCEKLESSEDLVVQMKARERTAGTDLCTEQIELLYVHYTYSFKRVF